MGPEFVPVVQRKFLISLGYLQILLPDAVHKAVDLGLIVLVDGIYNIVIIGINYLRYSYLGFQQNRSVLIIIKGFGLYFMYYLY